MHLGGPPALAGEIATVETPMKSDAVVKAEISSPFMSHILLWWPRWPGSVVALRSFQDDLRKINAHRTIDNIENSKRPIDLSL
jgi:hypothetical protein